MNLEKRFLNELNDFLHQERGRCHQVFHALQKIDRPFLLRIEIQNCFESLCRDDAAETLENTPLANVWFYGNAIQTPVPDANEEVIRPKVCHAYTVIWIE